MAHNLRGQFKDFYTAREFARSLKKKTKAEWKKYTVSGEKPDDIPACPETVYPEFDGYADWLGNGKSKAIKQDFRSYKEVEHYLCLHGVRTEAQWRAHVKSGLKPADIPSSLGYYYKEDGFTWRTFHKLIPKYLSYEEGRRYIRKNEPWIKTALDYFKYAASGKKPKWMPFQPQKMWEKDGFTWGDFLGTIRVGNQRKKFT